MCVCVCVCVSGTWIRVPMSLMNLEMVKLGEGLEFRIGTFHTDQTEYMARMRAFGRGRVRVYLI